MPKKPQPPIHLPLQVAADRIGIHANTLRKWADAEPPRIASTRDIYGNRIFPVAAVAAAATARSQK